MSTDSMSQSVDILSFRYIVSSRNRIRLNCTNSHKEETMRTTLLLVALPLLTFLLFCTTQKTPTVELQPCDVTGIKDKVKCGTLEVFENRATKAGRKINLKIVVAPATGPNRKADPLFYIPGGPGASATEDAPGVVTLMAKIRDQHDLVFVDQRGTGGSHNLDCS